MANLRARLIRMNFAEPDVDRVLAQLGETATFDNATALLSIVILKRVLADAGFKRMGTDPVTKAETWEA